MKVTAGDIMSVREFFSSLYYDTKIRAKDCLKISPLTAQILEKADEIEKCYRKIVTKYGEAEESGRIVVPPDKMSAAAQEREELLEEEIHITENPIDFSLIENMEITPQVMQSLQKFIKIKGEE